MFMVTMFEFITENVKRITKKQLNEIQFDEIFSA